MNKTLRFLALCIALVMLAVAMPVFAEDATTEPTESATPTEEVEITDPVLATVDGKEILQSEVEYIAYALYYYQYTESATDYQAGLDYIIQQMLIDAQIAKLGLDQFTDEENAAFELDAQEQRAELVESYIATYKTAESTEEDLVALKAEAEEYCDSVGYSLDDLIKSLKQEASYTRLDEQLLANTAAPTEDDITATFNQYAQQYKDMYEGNIMMYEYYTQYYGYESWYTPEGYRNVLHILLDVDDALLTDYQDKVALLEEASSAETPAEDAVTQADVDAAKAAILAACQAQLDEIYAKLEAGETFQSLIPAYNTDPGMQDEAMVAAGYPVHAESVLYDAAFTAGAFSDKMQKIGDVSDPIISSFGVHVMYYLSDLPAGFVEIDEAIRAEIEQYLINNQANAAYQAAFEQWEAEANIVYDEEALNALMSGY